ncbi:hypothetical protein AS188_07495 [Kocuria flava]|uniref:Lantibiotic dehydratase N-terminal domain-containing protein n=1 Tax=Kocuria flava TaxID=446860 RepID=A0A0U3HQ16_9MICC|nr:hypothetical protein [Kocuria flava]ALU39622.1 hypothetical protein AS188_07495 [Kocuria flava]GEO91995.1 hypothetical protein KFL01_13010 [Kocuria flava]
MPTPRLDDRPLSATGTTGDAAHDDVMDVRLAALPAGVLAQLRFTATRSALEARERAHRALEQCTAAADAVLYTAIGTAGTSGAPAKELLRIKRALGRGRTPSAEALAGLPDPVAAALRQVAAARTAHEDAAAHLETAFAADLDRTRSLLAGLAADPLLRTGILRSAPTLEALVDAATWPAHLSSDKRATRVAQFVHRAAAKTSPFSTFTCTGRSGSAVDDGALLRPGAESVRLVRQLDGKIWALLLQDLRGRDALAAVWPVRPNPSLTWLPSLSRTALLGPPPEEQLRLLPEHPALRAVRTGPPEPVPAQVWTRRLTGELGLEADDDGLVPMLLRAGALQAQDPVSEHGDRPVGELVHWLELHGLAPAVPWFPLLARLAGLLEPKPRPTDASAQRVHRRELDGAVEDLLAALGHTPDELGADLEPVHESAVLDRPVLPASVPTAGDLDLIGTARSWLSALDVKWPGRLAVAAFAETLLPEGGSLPLLEFYRAVHQELRRGDGPLAEHLRTWFAAVPRQPGLDTPLTALTAGLRQLHEERRRATELVGRCTDAQRQSARIPLELVQEQLRLRPELLRSGAPAAAYLQATQEPGSRWVVNVLHGGHGRGRARTDHLMRCAGLDPRPLHPARPDRPAGAVAAEWTGTHGSSLNARRPVLPTALDYPHTTGPASGQRRVPVGRLHVRRSAVPGLLELVDPRDGTVVVPAHVGMLADYQLPPLARFVERVFGDAYLLHPSNPPFASDLPLDRLTGITRLPRVQVEDVVVQRRRFVVPADLLPRPVPSQSRAVYLGQLRDWFADHGLPSTAYARAWGQELRGDKVKARKPMLLDLDSWWTVTELLRHSGGARFVVLDEALPDPYHHDAASPVTELLAEVPPHRPDDGGSPTP